MQAAAFIARIRNPADERQVFVELKPQHGTARVGT
jgi:hypothetical protein